MSSNISVWSTATVKGVQLVLPDEQETTTDLAIWFRSKDFLDRSGDVYIKTTKEVVYQLYEKLKDYFQGENNNGSEKKDA